MPPSRSSRPSIRLPGTRPHRRPGGSSTPRRPDGLSTPRHLVGPRNSLFAYVLIAPALLAVGALFYLPMVLSFSWSFTKYNGNTPPTWVGLRNYETILTAESTHGALWHTAVFTLVTMTVGPALGLGSALLLNQSVRLRVLFRNAFFLPVVMPLVVAGTIWKMLLADRGLINGVLGAVGITGADWLANPSTALLAIAAASIWQGFGFETVVFLSALQSVPRDLYDAASVDGAGAWQKFRAVTLPALRPTMVFVFVVGLIGAFQTYDQIYVMTGGGPIESTSTIVFLLVEKFHDLRLGQASAIAYLLLVILAILSAVQMRLGRGR